jgi:hypothetical protein
VRCGAVRCFSGLAHPRYIALIGKRSSMRRQLEGPGRGQCAPSWRAMHSTISSKKKHEGSHARQPTSSLSSLPVTAATFQDGFARQSLALSPVYVSPAARHATLHPHGVHGANQAARPAACSISPQHSLPSQHHIPSTLIPMIRHRHHHHHTPPARCRFVGLLVLSLLPPNLSALIRHEAPVSFAVRSRRE